MATKQIIANNEVKNVSIEANEVKVTETKVMKLSEAKKVIISEWDLEMQSPFKVLNFINKNRTKEAYKVLFEAYLIQDKESGKQRKLELSDLLQFTPEKKEGATEEPQPIFCKLVSSDKKGEALKTFTDKDGKEWYYVPTPFSVRGFFASVAGLFALNKKEAAKRVWESNATARAAHEKKQREKLSAKIKEMKESDTYKGLPSETIELIARDITGVRISLS